MADEIRISASLSVQKGGVWDGLAVRDLLSTFTGTNMLHQVQAVGTAEELVQVGDSGAGPGGWAMFVNRGPTNFVSLRGALGQTPFARLNAGESAGPFRIHPSAALTAQADTAGVDLEIFILEP